jgi:hypothetical protein
MHSTVDCFDIVCVSSLSSYKSMSNKSYPSVSARRYFEAETTKVPSFEEENERSILMVRQGFCSEASIFSMMASANERKIPGMLVLQMRRRSVEGGKQTILSWSYQNC